MKSIFMSQEIQVIHLLPHSMYVHYTTHPCKHQQQTTNAKTAASKCHVTKTRKQETTTITTTTTQKRERHDEGSNCQAGAWTAFAFILSLTQVHAWLGRQYYNCVDIFCAQSILFIISDKSDSNSAIILINTCFMYKEGSQSLYTLRGYSCCATMLANL